MRNDIATDIKVSYESLLISLDKSINTLQSNFYINKICLSYLKMICLEGVCFAILNNEKLKCKIDEYRLFNDIEYQFISHFPDYNNYFWYDMNEDAKIFFKLFDTYEIPFIQVRSEEIKRKPTFMLSTPTIPVCDYDKEALKVILIKHFSPPEYFVQGIEDILKYLITNNREKELQKINECLQHQEFLFKDMAIVEKVVSISKLLSDETIDGRIKLYVLHSLQVILDEQEKLHKKMGVTPSITHIDLLA